MHAYVCRISFEANDHEMSAVGYAAQRGDSEMLLVVALGRCTEATFV